MKKLLFGSLSLSTPPPSSSSSMMDGTASPSTTASSASTSSSSIFHMVGGALSSPRTPRNISPTTPTTPSNVHHQNATEQSYNQEQQQQQSTTLSSSPTTPTVVTDCDNSPMSTTTMLSTPVKQPLQRSTTTSTSTTSNTPSSSMRRNQQQQNHHHHRRTLSHNNNNNNNGNISTTPQKQYPYHQQKPPHHRTSSLTMVQVDVEYRNERFTIGAHTVSYSGTVLVGSYIPHGTGKLCYANGVTYEGEFHLGKRSGSGTLYYKLDPMAMGSNPSNGHVFHPSSNVGSNSPTTTAGQWLRSALTLGLINNNNNSSSGSSSSNSGNAFGGKNGGGSGGGGERYLNWSIMGLWEENEPRFDCKFKVKTDQYEYLGYLQAKFISSSSSSSSTSGSSSSSGGGGGGSNVTSTSSSSTTTTTASSSGSRSSVDAGSETMNDSSGASSSGNSASSIGSSSSSHIVDSGNIEHLFEPATLSQFKKCGEGEIHHTVHHERYIGEFRNDRRHGYGIQVYRNGDRYFGGWLNDKLDGFGTFLYNDGTMFQGRFQCGLAKGQGTMYWPNGDTMSGDWNGAQVKNGAFTKGSCDSCQKVQLYKMSHAIKQGLQSIEDCYYYNAERKREDKMSNSLKWQQYKILNEEQFRREQDLLSEIFVRKLYSLDTFEECIATLLGGYNTEERWFTNSAISFFISFFDSIYTASSLSSSSSSSMLGGESQRQLNETLVINDAKSDIDSFIVFLQDEIWKYFAVLFNQTQVSQKLKDSCKQSCMSMIRDHVHEQLAVTCFELYNRTYQDKDILANQKLDILRNRLTLDMLEIPRKFRPHHHHSHHHQSHHSHDRSDTLSSADQPSLNDGTTSGGSSGGGGGTGAETHSSSATNGHFLPDEPYAEAVSILSTLPRKETITAKLDVLNRTYRSFIDEMVMYRAKQRKRRRLRRGELCSDEEDEQKYRQDLCWEPPADDYTGVALYVYMKASKIRNHHAQFHYINHYSDSSISAGVLQLYEGILKYIDDLDPTLHTKTGALISAYSLSVSLDDAFHYVSRSTKSDRQAFSWLPHLLAFLSLEAGRRRSDDTLYIEIPSDAFVNLKERMIKYLPLVTSLLESAEKLGFCVVYEPDTNKLFIQLDELLPPHVYNELSIQTSTLVYSVSDRCKRLKRSDSTLKRIVS